MRLITRPDDKKGCPGYAKLYLPRDTRARVYATRSLAAPTPLYNPLRIFQPLNVNDIAAERQVRDNGNRLSLNSKLSRERRTHASVMLIERGTKFLTN